MGTNVHVGILYKMGTNVHMGTYTGTYTRVHTPYLLAMGGYMMAHTFIHLTDHHVLYACEAS